MTVHLHKHDLPDGMNFGSSVAVDTETQGLSLVRDKLCLVQLSAGDGDALIVQMDRESYNAPNLKKLMTCLLYTSPSPRDLSTSRMPSSA